MIVYVCADMTEVTGITSISPGPRMINTISKGSLVLGDFEGALYATYMDVAESVYWKDGMFQPLWIFADDDTTCLFAGRITNLSFLDGSVIVEFESDAGKMRDVGYSYNHNLATGIVKTVTYGADVDALELSDDNGAAFSWAADQWITGKDNAVLLTDNTGATNMDTWITTAGSVISNGNCTMTQYQTHAKTNTADADYHGITVEGVSGYFSATFRYTLAHSTIATSYKIRKFTLYCNVVAIINGIGIPTQPNNAYVKILIRSADGTKYLTNPTWLQLSPYYDAAPANWSFRPFIIEFKLDTAELDDYLHVTGGNYDTLNIDVIVDGYQRAASLKMRYIKIDYLAVKIEYDTATFLPLQKPITDSGTSWIIADNGDFVAKGVHAGDRFQIGENTRSIAEMALAACGVKCSIDTGFSHYMARQFKNQPIDALIQQICDIEDAIWFEEINDAGECYVKLLLRSNFAASGLSITDATHTNKFTIERPGNQYKGVIVYGNPFYNVFWVEKDADEANISPLFFNVIDESINTVSDAIDLAKGMLDKLKVVRPSYVVEVQGSAWYGVQLGTTVNLTFARPTIAAADYIIRRIDINQTYPNGFFKVKLYLGLGQSPTEEKLARTIQKALNFAIKAHTDKLTSAITGSNPVLSHGDLLNLSDDDHLQYHNNTRGDARYPLIAHVHALASTTTAIANKRLLKSNGSNPADSGVDFDIVQTTTTHPNGTNTHTQLDSHISQPVVANNVFYKAKEAGGTERELNGIDASDRHYLNKFAKLRVIAGDAIQFGNMGGDATATYKFQFVTKDGAEWSTLDAKAYVTHSLGELTCGLKEFKLLNLNEPDLERFKAQFPAEIRSVARRTPSAPESIGLSLEGQVRFTQNALMESNAELEQRIADLEREQREMKLQLSEIYMKIVGGEKHE